MQRILGKVRICYDSGCWQVGTRMRRSTGKQRDTQEPVAGIQVEMRMALTRVDAGDVVTGGQIWDTS